MSSKTFLYFALSILTSCCAALSWAAQEPSEIRVHLSTESALHPIYIGQLQAHNTLLDSSHLNALQSILSYDLNYNGQTKVCAHSAQKEQILLDKQPSVAFHPLTWKSFGISYAIKWQVTHKTLQVFVFNAQDGSLKTFSDIPLTGELKEDRRQIHKLADSIFKSLFGKDGISHSRILFAYQVKNSFADFFPFSFLLKKR